MPCAKRLLYWLNRHALHNSAYEQNHWQSKSRLLPVRSLRLNVRRCHAGIPDRFLLRFIILGDAEYLHLAQSKRPHWLFHDRQVACDHVGQAAWVDQAFGGAANFFKGDVAQGFAVERRLMPWSIKIVASTIKADRFRDMLIRSSEHSGWCKWT